MGSFVILSARPSQSSVDNDRNLLVWDADGPAPSGNWKTVLWRGFVQSDDADAISMPTLVEDQADTLKKRYLAWIYELGETRLGSKRLIDHLEVRPGFSYWWMTLLAEKSPSKSPRIFDAVKFFALEDIRNLLQPNRLILISSDPAIISTFKRWCQNIGIHFETHKPKSISTPISFTKRLYHLLPYSTQAAIWLVRYLSQRWPLKQTSQASQIPLDSELLFIDYFLNLDRSAFTKGQFSSNYWTHLVEAFRRSKTKVNWLHMYFQHDAVPTSRYATALIHRFNHTSAGFQTHLFVDSPLSVSLLFAAGRDYISLVKKSWVLRKISQHFRPRSSKLDLWPLFEQSWLDSMGGATAIWNFIALNLLERVMTRLPHQRLGAYLLENQGWEMALIHAWQASGHGKLIGVCHTTIRYWDLRYFHDPRSYARRTNNNLPLPDRIALNGPAAVDAYADGGYPESRIVEVEALRYLYLANNRRPRSPKLDLGAALRVLVCGDILPEVNRHTMGLLRKAAAHLPAHTRYIVIPHPGCPIKANDYPSLPLEMTHAALGELFDDCDVVFTSNSTSATVDAYCYGIPVVEAVRSSAFNMSALRSLHGVVHVSDPTTLARALLDANRRKSPVIQPYFWLDAGLPRWRKLLSLS